MMNKKGFVFIETIITTLVLLTTILVLYAAYSTSINGEKKRLYYDDIAYIYRTEFIARVLNETLDKSLFKNYLDSSHTMAAEGNRVSSNKYIQVFNYGTSGIWKNNNENISKLYNLYNWQMLFYIKYENINEIKTIIKNKGDNNAGTDKYKAYQMILTYGGKTFADYLLTLDVEPISEADGILVVIYKETKNGNLASQSYAECKAIQEAQGHNISDYSMTCETADYISWVYFKAGA